MIKTDSSAIDPRFAGESTAVSARPGEEHADAWKTLRVWLAALAYIAICLVIQWRANAGAAAFGTYPDEPAHYVAGLMVRDYMASGFSQSPVSFAQKYYEFRPYFGVGLWPPLFYCVEGAWMLLFGPARPMVLLL